MSENLLQQMKEKMIQTVNDLSFENYEQKKAYINEQFKALDSILVLHSYEQMHGFDVETAEEPDKRTNENPAPVVTPEIIEPEPETPIKPAESNGVYPFERLLRGGILPSIEAFVPESIVRSLNIEHGDLIHAEKIDNSSRRYNYTVVERKNAQAHEDRVQFSLCPVEQDGNFLCVSKSLQTGKMIRINDVPQKIIISNEDYLQFGLKAGDLIDVAFYKERAQDAKVIWRHDNAELPSTPVKKAEPQKKTNEKTKPEDSEKPLDGLNVCIIGESHKESLYKHILAKAGAELFMTDGKNKDMQIRAQVKRADIVVCLLKTTSHKGMNTAKDQAKESSIPFITTWTDSAATVVKTITEYVEKEQSAS